MASNIVDIHTARGIVRINLQCLGDRMWHKLTAEEQALYRAVAEEAFGEELGDLK